MSIDVECIQRILNNHIDQMSQSIDLISQGNVQLRFELIEQPILNKICEQVSSLLVKEPTILELEGECIVIGDLHGHILDLYRIFTTFDLPPRTNYLFLGDLVDRGGFSLELITLIFVLKLLYPYNIYFIRGNHEFCTSNSTFQTEINNLYGDNRLYQSFMKTFSYFPLAAKFDTIFCVHGGICGIFESLDQLAKIHRPINDFSNELVEGVLWSDPADHITDLEFIASHRGRGCCFTKAPFQRFLSNNKLTLMIRAHECVDAVKIMFDSKLLTVFSASSYVDQNQNRSGVVKIKKDFSVITFNFKALKYLPRESAEFTKPQFVYNLGRIMKARSDCLNRTFLASSGTGLNLQLKETGSVNNSGINDPQTLSRRRMVIQPRFRSSLSITVPTFYE